MNVQEIVNHLVRMGNDPRTNENEAAAALARASALMAKHGIEATDDERKARVVRGELHQRKHWHTYIADAVRSLFPVDYVFKGDFLQFIGSPAHLDVAQYTHTWLINQVELFYKRALPKGLSKDARAVFRASFKDACAIRIRIRAHQLWKEMTANDAAAQAATGHNALVVIEDRKGWMAAIDEELKDAKQAKPQKVRKGFGGYAGWAAGELVQLRPEINDVASD